MTAQLALLMRDTDRAALGAVRVRKRAVEVADRIGRKTLGDDWQCGETNVGNKLNDAGRHRLHLDELVDLILRDRDLGILAELNELAGCEAPERKRVLEPGEKLERLTEALGELLGPEMLEVVERKAGLR